MKKISFFCFKIICLLIVCIRSQYDGNENTLWFQGKSWIEVEQSIFSGELNGYYSLRELNTLITKYINYYPDIFRESRVIGETYEKRQILSVKIGFPPNKKKIPEQDQGTTLLVGGHRGSDFIGMTLTVYLMKKIIYEYMHQNPFYINLLETRTIWIVPMLNVDGYNYIFSNYNTKHFLLTLEKNRHPPECDIATNTGVNLGTNYDYDFYQSDSFRDFTDSCSKNYRGQSPFSESETGTIRSLISTYKMDIALNYIGNRNAVFLPANSKGSSAGNTSSSYKSVEDYKFFETFKIQEFLPPNSFFGNRFSYQQEIVTGEPSDYMYHNHSIYALTLELATDEPASQVIFPTRDPTMKILRGNIYFTLLSIMKSGSFLRFYTEFQNWETCRGVHDKLISCLNSRSNYFLRVVVKNEGLRGSLDDEKISVGIEGNIDLVGLFTSPGIKSSNIFEEDWTNITSKMTYSSFLTTINVTKRYYNISLPAVANGSSLVLLLVGYIPETENLNLGSVEYIQNNLRSNEAFQNFWLKSDKINVQRSSFISSNIPYKPSFTEESNMGRLPSIVLIIIYFSIVFILIMVGIVKSILDKRTKTPI